MTNRIIAVTKKNGSETAIVEVDTSILFWALFEGRRAEWACKDRARAEGDDRRAQIHHRNAEEMGRLIKEMQSMYPKC